MFSYLPYHTGHRASYGNLNPFQSNTYARQLAKERALRAQYAAAQREKDARAQARSRYLYDDDDEEPYGLAYSPSPVYVDTLRQRELAERERAAREQDVLVNDRTERVEPEAVEDLSSPAWKGLTFYMPQEQPSPRTPPTPSPPTRRIPSPEELESAATKIQTFHRQHKSLSSIKSLAQRFEMLKANFRFPPKIDFIFPSEPGTIKSFSVSSDSTSTSLSIIPLEESTPSSAKLAYTSTNVPIHAYNEELSRLLVALDAVESYGGKKVRTARREVVGMVEEEARRIERLVGNVWDASTVQESDMNSTEGVEEQMDVRETIDAVREGTLVEESEVAKEISPETPTLEAEVDVQVDTAWEEIRDGEATELVNDEASEPLSRDKIRNDSLDTISHDEIIVDMELTGGTEQTGADNADMEEAEVESVLVSTDTEVDRCG